MRNSIYVICALFLFISVSCEEESNSESNCYTESDPPGNSHKVTIEQGLWGDVWFWSGNFMPPGRGEICQVVRKILVYELTTTKDVEKDGYGPFYVAINTELITWVESDPVGFFQIELEPGTYSLFVQEGTRYYSNLFTTQGIFPVTIESDKVSEVRIDITYEAVY